MTRIELVSRFQAAKDRLGNKCEYSVVDIMELEPILAEAILSELEAKVAKEVIVSHQRNRTNADIQLVATPEVEKIDTVFGVVYVANAPAKSMEDIREELRLSKELDVDRDCYFKGHVYRIVQDNGGCWLICEGEPDADTVYQLVPKAKVEALVDEVFLLGDTVGSVYGHCKGKVMGYELESNRVVIKTFKTDDNSRVRFAYKVSEVQLVK